MTVERTTHQNIECLRIVEGPIEILVAESAGPRILGFRLLHGPQLFASLPGLQLDVPGHEPFSLHGGHRLWVAPETPAVSYAPDDHPVAIASDARGVSVLAPIDAAGVEKSISLVVRGTAVVVDHTIVNAGNAPMTIAPWAITQLAPGGTGLIPLGGRLDDEYRADRSIVTWPYTRWDDPLMTIADHHIVVEAARTDPLKIGTALRREWLGYRLDGHLFVKRAAYPSGLPLADLGATGQCYCNHAFLELETLGPLATVPPGAAVHHREIWEIHEVPSHTGLARIAAELGLDHPSPLMEVVV